MSYPENTLREAFNRCAGKVVAVQDIENYMLEALKQSLTQQQLKEYIKNVDHYDLGTTKSLFKETFTDSLRKEIGDGSAGVYYKNGDPEALYLHIKVVESINKDAAPKTELSEKLSAALAKAIIKAPDHRDDVKKGRLIPLKI